MKYICLKIDYRDKTVSWWDWDDKYCKQETVYNYFTHERALYTTYKIENNITAIYETLVTDMWAAEHVIQKPLEGLVLYGDKFIISKKEFKIYIRTYDDGNEYKIYFHNFETDELEPFLAR